MKSPRLSYSPGNSIFRNAATLVPLIKKWIRPGTTIVSDCWKAYSGLSKEGYDHLTVNHSLHFKVRWLYSSLLSPFLKDPESGANTNRIESSWRHAKESFSTHGRVKYHVPGNLARYMFVKAARTAGQDPTDEFFSMAAVVYPGTDGKTAAEEEGPKVGGGEEEEEEENDMEDVELLEEEY